MKYLVNGHEVELESTAPDVSIMRLSDRLMIRTPDGSCSAAVVNAGGKTWVSYRGRVYEIEQATRAKKAAAAGTGELHAPMPGVIVDILVAEGDRVAKGDKVVVLEAMKTQQPFLAPYDGLVISIPVQKGDQVLEGALLAKIEK